MRRREVAWFSLYSSEEEVSGCEGLNGRERRSVGSSVGWLAEIYVEYLYFSRPKVRYKNESGADNQDCSIVRGLPGGLRSSTGAGTLPSFGVVSEVGLVPLLPTPASSSVLRSALYNRYPTPLISAVVSAQDYLPPQQDFASDSA